MRRVVALLFITTVLVFAQTHQLASTAYGGLYEDNASGSTINITDASTYYPWTTSAVGSSRNMTLSAASDNITIVEGGTYLVSIQISFSGSNTVLYTWAVHKNDSALTGLKVQRYIGTGTDVGSASMSGIVELATGDVLNLEVLCDGASKIATVYYVQMNVVLMN